MPVHFPHHEHHGEGFAGALRVPDDTAAVAGSLSFQKAFHSQFHGAELLVAPDNFDGLALLAGGEQCESADEVEDVVAVKHAGHEALLVVGAAAAVLQVIAGPRGGGGPTIEILVAVGCDGAELGLLPASGDEELVEIKERRAAFTLGATLLAIPHELVDGLRDRFFDLR